MLVENDEVLGADQGNNDQHPSLEVKGFSVAIGATNEFGDKSLFTARPYVSKKSYII